MMKKLPVGVENFREMIDRTYYYVDKTSFIAQTFDDKVALYTRPRRFGKTLNLSMLEYFYSIKEKPKDEKDDIFLGLNISKNGEAKKYRNRYPVISLSLKDVEGDTFDIALSFLSSRIQEIAGSFQELYDSEYLSDTDKKQLQRYEEGTTDYVDLANSLRFYSRCLAKHYKEKVIILIDEYDEPLDKSYQHNYHDQMNGFIRSFLSSALKSNDSLEKGILTGCLCISSESVITGLNNLSVYSIMDKKAASAFGFTQEEVSQMYTEYGFADKLPEVHKWYDGYQFGGVEIYNPWSALQYLNALLEDPDEKPVSYWANSSSNHLVTQCIENADQQMMDDFQALINGKSIVKKIRPNLTYRDMEDSDNVYSFLLLTGYLKTVKKGTEKNTFELKIPNLEVKEIYEEHFNQYFGKLKKR